MTAPDHSQFPERITVYVRELMRLDESGAVSRQFTQTDDENRTVSCELVDPLGEAANTPVRRIIRKYSDRALLFTTDICAAHCRYCFRRGVTGSGRGVITDEELSAAVEYLGSQTDIRELLLSGGDPLTIPVERLSDIMDALSRERDDLVIRVCTRIPIVAPESVARYLDILQKHNSIWFVVQVNHPAELAPAARNALASVIRAGIPVVSQTVLLNGVNDSVEVLVDLFTELLSLRIKPYQLFQADLVPGTSHLRVPLRRGVALYEELKRRISTLALPVYTVDAPGGGGKIPLGPASLERIENGFFLLEGLDGNIYRYPDEDDSSHV